MKNKKFILLLIIFLQQNVLIVFSKDNEIKTTEKHMYNYIITDIDAPNAKKLIEQTNPLILDVRTYPEYGQSHIKNSLNIPLDQLERRISEIAIYRKKNILIYCRSGRRSAEAALILLKNNFKKIYNLKYGLISWTEQGYSVEK